MSTPLHGNGTSPVITVAAIYGQPVSVARIMANLKQTEDHPMAPEIFARKLEAAE